MIPSQLPLFLAVVKAGSFSAAARDQGISTAAVSKAIARLEKTLQIRLFHRTTHSLSLTGEGLHLHQRTAPLLEALQDEISTSMDIGTEITGTIKINLPNDFGQDVVYPRLLEFLDKHPNIELDLHFDDRVQDLVGNGFDIGIGNGNGFDIGIGNRLNEDSRLIARRYYKLRVFTVCSPAYASRYGLPNSVEELNQHNCIAFRSQTTGRVLPWPFTINDEQVQFAPKGRLVVNSPIAAQKAAESGLGIATIGHWQMSAALESGRLVRVLEDDESPPLTVWLYYSSRSYLPTRTRLLIDFLMNESA